MPASPLDGPPFRGRNAQTLQRIVDTVRSVLEPDVVDLEYVFEPQGQRYRWRMTGSHVAPLKVVRTAIRGGGPSVLSAPFAVPGLVRGVLALARGPRRPWTGPETLRFEVLRPMLAQLLEFAAACEIHAAARRRLESAADATPTPVFLVRASGTILYANAAATALLFGRGAEPHVAADGARDVPLHGWIQRLASSAPAGTKRRGSLTDGRHFEASVARFSDEEEDVAVLTLRLLSTVSPEDVRTRLAERGVSGREAEVVGAVLEGLRNAEIARRLFITEWTVKDHLKHVFSKLGVSSRGGLLRALDAGPGFPCPEETRPARPQPVESRTRRTLKM
ncbi:MAG TPA: LuxR C-terminal-related transcriptional regulator [Thermoanaerobaculia bacterium]|jgi:DNA-binding CsgD family transcriptional regulator